MADKVNYVPGPDIADDEELRDSRGRLVDDDYVTSAVEEAVSQVRGRGRPSLSESGESPLLRVRLSTDLNAAVSDVAARAGLSRAEWVRSVLDEAVRRAG